MKQSTLLYSLVFFGLLTTLCLATGLEVPENDPLQDLLSLWTNWKAWSPLMIASGMISFVVNSARKFLPSGNIKQIAVVMGGVAYAILQSIVGGVGWAESLVAILLTSGGAVVIYELFFKRVNKVVETIKKG